MLLGATRYCVSTASRRAIRALAAILVSSRDSGWTLIRIANQESLDASFVRVSHTRAHPKSGARLTLGAMWEPPPNEKAPPVGDLFGVQDRKRQSRTKREHSQARPFEAT